MGKIDEYGRFTKIVFKIGETDRMRKKWDTESRQKQWRKGTKHTGDTIKEENLKDSGSDFLYETRIRKAWR